MHALRDTAVPVPRMLHYCSDRTVLGTPFYVMDFLEGRIFRETALPAQTLKERSAI